MTFELKLRVEFAQLRLSTRSAGLAGNRFFTESLILAQDERWRRA